MRYIIIIFSLFMLSACAGESASTTNGTEAAAAEQKVLEQKMESVIESVESETEAIVEETENIEAELNELLNELK